jgi:hypothetical protein
MITQHHDQKRYYWCISLAQLVKPVGIKVNFEDLSFPMSIGCLDGSTFQLFALIYIHPLQVSIYRYLLHNSLCGLMQSSLSWTSRSRLSGAKKGYRQPLRRYSGSRFLYLPSIQCKGLLRTPITIELWMSLNSWRYRYIDSWLLYHKT